MSWGYYSWRPYVSVAERRAQGRRALAKQCKGRAVSPVVLESRKIATTFWGKAWCDNLEAYSDYANRMPRGRTYVRNGSVLDLQIQKGKVTARVCGYELYTIEIEIKPLAKPRWQAIQAECAGKIDSLLELLQGRLSDRVMEIVTRPERGLFPAPKEIDFDCSCPDWADMCKHVAAALYGVGARLDHKPELLFLLRGVQPEDLISKVSAREAVRQAAPAEGAAAIPESELAGVFGIEVEAGPAKPAPAKEATAAQADQPRPEAKPKAKRPPGRPPKSKRDSIEN